MPDTNAINTEVELSLDSLEIQSEGPMEGEEQCGIVLVPAPGYRPPVRSADHADPHVSSGMSWIYIVLAALFCITCMRFKGSVRYIQALLIDLTDTRVRHNMFDDTVKETSLILLLNALWIVSSGILLWLWVRGFVASHPDDNLKLSLSQSGGIALCSCVTLGYVLLMLVAYWIVGNVFSDSKLTKLWIKGASASTALQSFILLPIAIVALNYASWTSALLIIAFIVFIGAKIIFLYKGFRIFFAQISSWLLFLYYLCSLEIIPVILTFMGAVAVCTD